MSPLDNILVTTLVFLVLTILVLGTVTPPSRPPQALAPVPAFEAAR